MSDRGSAALVDALAAALPEYGYTPTPQVARALARYLQAVERAPLRLVGSTEQATLVRRHLGESLYLGQMTELGAGVEAGGALVDVGSGAGFPGLALALAWPGLATTLVESTGKKARFLQQVVEEQGLRERVRVVNHYLERQPPVRPGPEAGELRQRLAQARWVTVRALEGMEAVPGWLGRWLGAETVAAFWVSAAMAAGWREAYPAWAWEPWRPLPQSERRGIVLARVLARVRAG